MAKTLIRFKNGTVETYDYVGGVQSSGGFTHFFNLDSELFLVLPSADIERIYMPENDVESASAEDRPKLYVPKHLAMLR